MGCRIQWLKASWRWQNLRIPTDPHTVEATWIHQAYSAPMTLSEGMWIPNKLLSWRQSPSTASCLDYRLRTGPFFSVLDRVQDRYKGHETCPIWHILVDDSHASALTLSLEGLHRPPALKVCWYKPSLVCHPLRVQKTGHLLPSCDTPKH